MKEEKAEREYEAYSRNVTERDVADVVEKEKSILTKVKGPLKRFCEAITLNFGFIIRQFPHHEAEYCTTTVSFDATISAKLSCSISVNIFFKVFNLRAMRR